MGSTRSYRYQRKLLERTRDWRYSNFCPSNVSRSDFIAESERQEYSLWLLEMAEANATSEE